MLLVLLCFMSLVGLMVVIKACCQSQFFRGKDDSTDNSSDDSVVQVSVVESTVSTPVLPYHTNINIIPDVLVERSCRMQNNNNSNNDFIDIDFSLPPSYEEAVKMPLPFRSVSWWWRHIKSQRHTKKSQYPIARTYKYWWSYQIFLTQPEKKKRRKNFFNCLLFVFFIISKMCQVWY